MPIIEPVDKSPDMSNESLLQTSQFQNISNKDLNISFGLNSPIKNNQSRLNLNSIQKPDQSNKCNKNIESNEDEKGNKHNNKESESQ